MGSNQLIAVLDANVLYPFFQRDLLLNLGYEELYIPKWSDEIEQEWIQQISDREMKMTAKRLMKEL